MSRNKEGLATTFIDLERHRLIYFIKDEAERKYKEFKKVTNEAAVILYVGDFRPQTSKAGNGGLELMLPSEIFMTVPYSLVLISLLRVFDLDRLSNDFEVGSTDSYADINTLNLNRFTKEHPDGRLKKDYMFFELMAPEDEYRMILMTKYSDPITKEPLTLAFEAIKYKK